ncbi:hypothetical protein [Actinomadura sp. 21ATH]|uniref:hypothetical protein n=1 Tax=Actinomadura sp. 21ATH TaxID=1735444 RepID=UPI0035BFAB25
MFQAVLTQSALLVPAPGQSDATYRAEGDPVQAVNAYLNRLVWLRYPRDGIWLTVPWRLLSSTATPFGEPVALSMTWDGCF